jgi:hypothetical protein
MPTLTTTTLGRFCRELAGGLDSLPVLLQEWGVSEQDFADIQTSPAFITEMKLVQLEMQELGNDAGYIYRMKSLSESMLPEVVALLQDKNTSPMLKFDVIRWVAEMARLKEKPVPKGDLNQGPRGPSVIFHFGAGLPVQSMKVIGGDGQAQVDVNGNGDRLVDKNVGNDGWPL